MNADQMRILRLESQVQQLVAELHSLKRLVPPAQIRQETMIRVTQETVQNTMRRGFRRKGGAIDALITEGEMSLSDVLTLNVSTTKHGFCPKAPNETTKFLRGDGAWAVPPYTMDHGSLNGLADDDHSQYLTEARHTALAGDHVTNGDSHDHAGGDGAQIDHGGLAGLGDDDHSQYLNTTRHDTPNRHGDAVLFSTQLTDYFSSSTIVGWAASPTGYIKYKRIGNTVIVYFYITGTSNSTSVTFTLPAAAIAGIDYNYYAVVEDNGIWLNTPGLASLPASSSTVTIYKNVNGDNWTASGEKLVAGTLIYEAAS